MRHPPGINRVYGAGDGNRANAIGQNKALLPVSQFQWSQMESSCFSGRVSPRNASFSMFSNIDLSQAALKKPLLKSTSAVSHVSLNLAKSCLDCLRPFLASRSVKYCLNNSITKLCTFLPCCMV